MMEQVSIDVCRVSAAFKRNLSAFISGLTEPGCSGHFRTGFVLEWIAAFLPECVGEIEIGMVVNAIRTFRSKTELYEHPRTFQLNIVKALLLNNCDWAETVVSYLGNGGSDARLFAQDCVSFAVHELAPLSGIFADAVKCNIANMHFYRERSVILALSASEASPREKRDTLQEWIQLFAKPAYLDLELQQLGEHGLCPNPFVGLLARTQARLICELLVPEQRPLDRLFAISAPDLCDRIAAHPLSAEFIDLRDAAG